MASSLLALKLKIIIGYVILILLFVVLLALTYRENKRLSVIDKYSETTTAQQNQAETIAVQVLDIALLMSRMMLMSVFIAKSETVLSPH